MSKTPAPGLVPGLPILPTTIVGSYPQPDWLIDRDRLKDRLPPRVRAQELWRIPEDLLTLAQEDATVLALHDQELAGVDILGDGEMRRESYSNRLATALTGIDIDHPGTAMDRTGAPNPVPRVAGRIARARPIEADTVTFLKSRTRHPVKITLPGPFTMTQQAQNDHYPSEEALAFDYADAVREEIADLFARGCDVVQLDEPYLQARPEKARAYGVAAINRALAGITGPVVIHICFGYAHVHRGAEKPSGYSFLPELEAAQAQIISVEAAQPKVDLAVLRDIPTKTIMLGVIDLNDPQIETPAVVAARIRAALRHVGPERIWVAPDCGMKYLSRDTAFGKLKAMVEGAAIVRRELA